MTDHISYCGDVILSSFAVGVVCGVFPFLLAALFYIASKVLRRKQ